MLHLWSGLGYYSRARNLHRAAQRIVAEHGGELPDEPEALAALPGIGRSTAAAILPLSPMAGAAAILDGNVRRVLSRYFGIEGPRGARATELRAVAARRSSAHPQRTSRIYTQAIMDFGATLCTRRQPLCVHCPLQRRTAWRIAPAACRSCPRARARARATAALGRDAAAPSAPTAACCCSAGRRRASGAGCGRRRSFEVQPRRQQFCARELRRCAARRGSRCRTLQHAFTHFDLEITPLRARCRGGRR